MDSDDFYVQYSGRSCNLSVQLCFHHSLHLCVSCVVCMCVCLSVCLSVWVFVVVGFVVVGLFVVVGFVVIGLVRCCLSLFPANVTECFMGYDGP